MFQSHKHMIDAWPDLTAFAVDIGVSYNTAKQMRRRGSVHSDHWWSMIAGARARGIEGVTWEAIALAKSKAA